jgi:hypothetical protein
MPFLLLRLLAGYPEGSENLPHIQPLFESAVPFLLSRGDAFFFYGTVDGESAVAEIRFVNKQERH